MQRSKSSSRHLHKRLLYLLLTVLLSVVPFLPQTVADLRHRHTPIEPHIQGWAWQPYRAGQGPEVGQAKPQRWQMDEDMVVLGRHAQRIRTYGATSEWREAGEMARAHGLLVLQGAWIGRDPERNRAEIVAALEQSRKQTSGLIIGSESQYRGDIEAPQLLDLIIQAKAASPVPVSTAEGWPFWLLHPEFVEQVDFITIHVLPFWEDRKGEDPVTYAISKVEAVRHRYPGKRLLIGETGWPSAGDSSWGEMAKLSAQADYLARFLAWTKAEGIETYVMEGIDGAWKTSIEGKPGPYWGVYDAARRSKYDLNGTTIPLNMLPLIVAIMLALFLAARQGRQGPATLAADVLTVIALAAIADQLVHYYHTPLGLVTFALTISLIMVALWMFRVDARELEGLKTLVSLPSLGPLPADDGRMVSIHLATHAEAPQMVAHTLKSLAALNWRNKEIVVLDNNTADPALWQPARDAARTISKRTGVPIYYYHYEGVKGFKAGALNIALGHTNPKARYIAVVDADYEVNPDWLRHAMDKFAPGVAFVQAPQEHRDGQESLFKLAITEEYRTFFLAGMRLRAADESFIQHGTMTVLDRSILEASGGWATWSITEDAELGLRLQSQGYGCRYIPSPLGTGLSPHDWRSYRRQRCRWAIGGLGIAMRRLPALFRGGARGRLLARRYVEGWASWIGDAILAILVPLTLIWAVLMPQSGGLLAPPFAALSLTMIAAALGRQIVRHLITTSVNGGDHRRAALACLAGQALSPSVGVELILAALRRATSFEVTPKSRQHRRDFLPLLHAALAVLVAAALARVAYEATWNRDSVLWSIAAATQILPLLASVTVGVISNRTTTFAAATFEQEPTLSPIP
ncbi:MAG: glycosyltransferase family 2 protein [Desulfurivibrionaceae bacterium]